MTLNKETVQTIVSICVLVGIVFGAVSYFATAQELEQVAMRLENKIVADQILALSQRIWQLEERYKPETNCMLWRGPHAERDRQEYKFLKLKLEELKKAQSGKN